MKKALTDFVWLRARSTCEYCQFPSQFAVLPFEIDHVIARKHHGETVESNLCLACFYCNSYKGPNIAGLDPDSGEVTRLFHPRNDIWSEHIAWSGPTLNGLTAIGRTTVDVLCINDTDAVYVRESLIEEGVFPASPNQ